MEAGCRGWKVVVVAGCCAGRSGLPGDGKQWVGSSCSCHHVGSAVGVEVEGLEGEAGGWRKGGRGWKGEREGMEERWGERGGGSGGRGGMCREGEGRDSWAAECHWVQLTLPLAPSTRPLACPQTSIAVTHQMSLVGTSPPPPHRASPTHYPPQCPPPPLPCRPLRPVFASGDPAPNFAPPPPYLRSPCTTLLTPWSLNPFPFCPPAPPLQATGVASDQHSQQ